MYIDKYVKLHRFDSYIMFMRLKTYMVMLVPILNVIIAFMPVVITLPNKPSKGIIDKMLSEVASHVRKNYPDEYSQMIREDKRLPEYHVIKQVVERRGNK